MQFVLSSGQAGYTTNLAALAVSHFIEHQTGWSIKKFVRTARRYRTVRIKAGSRILTAADSQPDGLLDALKNRQCATKVR